MLKRIKFTKDLFVKLIAGGFVLVFFLNLLYGIGFFITVEYLGDYNKAQSVVFNYNLLTKMFLGIATGFFFIPVFVISFVVYRIGFMLFGKKK